MSSTDADTETDTEVVDEARAALVEAIRADLGDAVVDTHLIPGRDLWVRVTTEAWGDLADYLRNRQRFRFFDWLSAVDWMTSPYGRSMDAEVDKLIAPPEEDGEQPPSPAESAAASHAGGDARFQVMARVHSLTTGLGLTVKADVGDDMTVGSWTGVYPGTEWHEREVWEMFGISFDGHPGLRNLYLPTGFEGNPLRKDYPLLSRLVKPWPGIVDVEPMPEADDEAGGSASD